jgi:hypothetical protein
VALSLILLTAAQVHCPKGWKVTCHDRGKELRLKGWFAE